MKIAALFTLFCLSTFAADPAPDVKITGTTCVITITLDVTTEKAASVIQKATPGQTLAQVKQTFFAAITPRIHNVINDAKTATEKNDAAINAQATADTATITAAATSAKAARPTVGDPTQ